jgi:hypothetical protein
MDIADKDWQSGGHHRKMTVANIREQSRPDCVEVVFLESARFYRLLRKNPAFDDLVRQLRDALRSGHMVNVGVSSPESDVIEDLAF